MGEAKRRKAEIDKLKANGPKGQLFHWLFVAYLKPKVLKASAFTSTRDPRGIGPAEAQAYLQEIMQDFGIVIADLMEIDNAAGLHGYLTKAECTAAFRFVTENGKNDPKVWQRWKDEHHPSN